MKKQKLIQHITDGKHNIIQQGQPVAILGELTLEKLIKIFQENNIPFSTTLSPMGGETRFIGYYNHGGYECVVLDEEDPENYMI